MAQLESANSMHAATVPSDDASVSSSAPSVDLLSLPEEVLHSILDLLGTFELLQILAASPPSKSWASAWHSMSTFDVDLERDVGRAINQAAAALQSAGSDSNSGSNSGGNSMVVRQMLARKQHEYVQLLHLLSAHAKDLQSLSLANFGIVLQNDIAPLSASHKPINLLATLGAHSGSLTALSLTGSSLRRVDLGPEFARLLSLDLSRSKGLQDPRIDLPQLTSLDLSRTLLNDLELARILPNLASLRILKLIGCKNLRVIGGADPAALFRSKVPQLKIVDLSNTAVIDSSVNGIVRYALDLESLFLADCSELHQPRLCSQSLKTLCLRGCNRLKMSTRIWCPSLQELDLSKSNLRDGWVDGTGINSGGSEGRGVTRGGSGGCVHIPAIRTLLLQACYELVNPMFRIEQGCDDIVEEQKMARAERAAAAAGAGTAATPAGSSSACNDAPAVLASSSSASVSASSSAAPMLLPQVYPHLTSLDLGLSYSFSNKALMHLLVMSPRLEVLDLQQCKNVCAEWSDDDAPNARDDRVDVFPPGLSCLRELYARGCSLSDQNLALLMGSEAGLSLEVLILRNCVKVTGRGITRGPRLRELDLRLTQLTDEGLTDLLQAGTRLPSLRVLNIAQCSKLQSASVAHPGLEVLDASSCPALKSLALATPALRAVDCSLCFSLTQLDLSECQQLQSLNAQHSTAVHITSPLMHASREANGVGLSPLILASNGGLIENGLYSAAAALSSKDAQQPEDLQPVSKPLRAYSGAFAYREYTAQGKLVNPGAGPGAGARDSASSSSSTSAASASAAGSSPPQSSSQLSSKIGSNPHAASSAVAFGAKGNASLFDSVPLPTHAGAKRELAMTHSARPVVYNNNAYGLARTPPRGIAGAGAGAGAAAAESTPPGSPARRAQQPLSPASRTTAAGASPPRRRSSHPSLAPAAAASAALAAPQPVLSPPTASPHRGIRSVDLCILEEHAASLDAKLAAETAALASLLAHPVAAAGDAGAAAAAAWIFNVKDTKLQIYGLKKQVQVHRAKLKKEVRRMEAEAENASLGDKDGQAADNTAAAAAGGDSAAGDGKADD